MIRPAPLRLWVMCLLVSIAGCKDSGDASTPLPDPSDGPAAARLILEPAALLLQGEGATHELEVRAIDAEGHDVKLSALQLEVVSSNPGEISISMEDSGRVVARSVGSVGSATLIVRSQGQPGLTSNPVTAVAATLRPGVQTVEDARVVFPPPAASRGFLPGEHPADISTADPRGHVRIGSFSDEEVLALFKPVRDASGNPKQLLIPIVLRGEAPALGTLLFASESALLQGRVIQAEAREGFSLVQLEPQDLAAFFMDLKFSFDSWALQESGFVEPEPTPGLRQGLTASKAIDCSGSLGGISTDVFKLLDWRVIPTARFEIAVVRGVLQSIMLEAGLHVTGLAEGMVGLTSEHSVKFSCELPEGGIKFFSTPPLGPYMLFLSIQGSFSLIFEGEFTLTRGPPGQIKAQAKVDLPVSVGMEWTPSGGMAPRKTGEPTLTVEPSVQGPLFSSLDPTKDIASRANGKLGLYASAKVEANLGKVYEKVLRELAANISWLYWLDRFVDVLGELSVTLGEARVGPELLVNFDSRLQALQEQSDEGEVLLRGLIEARLLPGVIDFLQTYLGIGGPAEDDPDSSWNRWNRKWDLWKKTALRRSCHPPQEVGGGGGWRGADERPQDSNEPDTCGTRIRARRQQGVWVDAGTPVLVKDEDSVEVEVTTGPSPDMDPPEDFTLYLYRKGAQTPEKVGRLGAGSPSTGSFSVPSGLCAEVKDGVVEVHVVGTNRMAGKIPASSYLGSISLSCASLSFDCTIQGQPLVPGGSVVLAPDNCPATLPLECRVRSLDPELEPTLLASLEKGDGNAHEPAWSKRKENGATVFSTEVSLEKGVNRLNVKVSAPDPEAPGKRKILEAAFDMELACVKKVRPYFPPIPPFIAWPAGISWFGGGTTGGWVSPCFSCFLDFSWLRAIALTWGDPHLTTADGRGWTAYQLGEFWLARPQPGRPAGGLQVQVRHQRLPGFATWASFNTAAAIKAGDYTFEVRMPRGPDGGLPLDKRRDLELLINGERVSLNPQLYVISNDLSFRVARGNGLEITYRDPTAVKPLPHPNAAFSRVRIGTSGEANLIRDGGDPSEPVVSLDVSLETSGTYMGLLGTPDGNANNDFMKPDGTVLPGPTTEFVNSYLLRDASESLFTYQSGEGPKTFDVPQSSTLPSLSALKPYLDQVHTLLTVGCGLTEVEFAAVDPEFIKQSAYELAAGRTEKNMKAQGICGDGQVRPAPHYVSFMLTGKVTLAGRSDIGVGGARVRIIARERGRVLCDTVTIEDGRYGCGQPQDAADYTSLASLTLDYTVSGRGTELTRSVNVPPPAPDSTVPQSQDFEASVSRVLDLRGRVRDAQGVLLSGALVRLESPQRADVLTDANGEYQRYVVLPDGIRGGLLSLKAFSRDGRSSGGVSTGFDVPNAGIHTLSFNIDTVALPVSAPPPPAQSPSWVGVTGRLLNANLQQVGEVAAIQGTTVRVRRKETNQELCHHDVGDSQGRWGCGFEVVPGASAALNLVVEADGLPSARRELVLASSELPGPGQVVTWSLDLTARATTLIFQGRVSSSAAGGGLGDVEVAIQPLGTPHRSTRSAADGTYRVVVSLPSEADFGGPVEAVATLRGMGGVGELTRRDTRVLMLGAREVHGETWNVTFSTGTAVLSGRVLNELAEDEPIAGARVRVWTDGRALCESLTDAEGFYGCSVSTEGGGKIPLTYLVDRRGQGEFTAFGGRPAELDLSKIPPATVTPILPTRDLRVRPTTVRLQGEVRDASGQAVAGAQVGASLEGRQASPTYSAKDGRFTLTLALEDGRRSGKMRVSARRMFAAGALTAHAEPDFTVTVPNSRVDVPVTLTLNGSIPEEDTAARLHFMGRISNALLPGLPLPAARVEVRLGAGGPLLCGAVANDHGDYDCWTLRAPAPASPARFEYTLLVAGSPVGAPGVYEATVLQSPDVESRVVRDLQVSPTTLELRGRVTSDGTTPIAGVNVSLTGAAVGSTWTDAQGDYTLAVALSPTSTSFAATLTASINGLSVPLAVSGVLTPGGLTRQRENILFVQRRVKLRGTVRNELAAGSLVREAWVELRREGELLCATDLDFSTGGFTCPRELDLGGLAPVTLDWTARNAIDQRTGTVTLTPGDIPPAGQVGELNLSLHLPATTFVVEGSVRDTVGALLGGATVRASAAGAWVEGQTAADGTYRLYLVLKDRLDQTQDGQPATELSVEARVAEVRGTTRGLARAPRGELTPVTRHVDLKAVTRLSFGGWVRNTNAGNQDMREARVRVLREGVEPSRSLICEADIIKDFNGYFRYTCAHDFRGELLTSLTVRFQVLLQGTLIAEDRVVTYDNLTPGEKVDHKTKELFASPTTVWISGTLRDPKGQPMRGGWVSVSSGRMDPVAINDNGKYLLGPLALPSGVASFQDNVVVTREGYTSTSAVTRSALLSRGANVLEVVTQLTELRISFKGRMRGVWDQDEKSGGFRVRLKREGTVFCDVRTTYAPGTGHVFDCGGQVLLRGDEQGFDVEWEAAVNGWYYANGVRQVSRAELLPSGQSTPRTVTLALDGFIPGTSLKFTGTVRRAGVPVQGIKVGFLHDMNVETGADGRYLIGPFYFSPDETSYEFNDFITTSDGVDFYTHPASGPLVPGQINTAEHDFTLASTTAPGSVAWRKPGVWMPQGFEPVSLPYVPPSQGTDAIIVPGLNGVPSSVGIRSIRVADGSEKWNAEIGASITAAPVVDAGGMVYVGDGLGRVHSFNPTGSLRWRTDAPELYDDIQALALGDGCIYVLDFQGTLRAFRTADGQLLWTRPFTGHGWPYVKALMVTPVGTVVASSQSVGTSVFSALNGEDVWSNPNIEVVALSPDEHLIARKSLWPETDSIVKLDLDGKQTWSVPSDIWCSQPVVALDGSIFVTSSGGDLVKISTNGQLQGSVNLDSTAPEDVCSSSLLLGDDGSIYVVRTDGRWDTAYTLIHAVGPELVERWRYTRGHGGDPELSAILSASPPTLVSGKILFIANYSDFRVGLGDSLFAFNTDSPDRRMMGGGWAHRYRDDRNSSRSPASLQYRQTLLKGVVTRGEGSDSPGSIPLSDFTVTVTNATQGTLLGTVQTNSSGAYSLHWLSAPAAEDILVNASGPEGQWAEYSVHVAAGGGLVSKTQDIQISATAPAP